MVEGERKKVQAHIFQGYQQHHHILFYFFVDHQRVALELF